ncbi:hypothetical protein [Microbacterium candidum]|uniref:Uncharacterized protein n=1 Tax=Microbacterium candidum TaxID=3041922 RepID=A0ABT7MX74_9MICO|nr:hypothetical protein [Microbacterium sp. ASV49]MDL9979040.1 hypothetical protein [Microbacterium sp. ASV49]
MYFLTLRIGGWNLLNPWIAFHELVGSRPRQLISVALTSIEAWQIRGPRDYFVSTKNNPTLVQDKGVPLVVEMLEDAARISFRWTAAA